MRTHRVISWHIGQRRDMGHHWTPSGGDHGLRSTNVHMSTTQIGLLQSVYRTRKKLTRRGLAFWLLEQNGQG